MVVKGNFLKLMPQLLAERARVSHAHIVVCNQVSSYIVSISVRVGRVVRVGIVVRVGRVVRVSIE